jgi:hypothetical protein
MAASRHDDFEAPLQGVAPRLVLGCKVSSR